MARRRRHHTLQLLLPLLVLAALAGRGGAFAVTHCHKNISVKYQVPVAKLRSGHRHQQSDGLTELPIAENSSADAPTAEQYVEYEERTRWDTLLICCPGYRTILFGLCEPLCPDACPAHSYCAAPGRCGCVRGYEASHHPNKEHGLICRPVCVGGCPEHAHCVAHNACECRAGYKDASAWFGPLRCERIQCAAHDQRYDVGRRMCVKIEMSMEELMQRVGERLAQGHLDGADGNDLDDDADGDGDGEDTDTPTGRRID